MSARIYILRSPYYVNIGVTAILLDSGDRFGPKVDQIGHKKGKFGTFSDPILGHFWLVSKKRSENRSDTPRLLLLEHPTPGNILSRQ